MIATNSIAAAALAVAIALICRFVWSRLSDDARPPVMVYLGSYFLTYCIGGIWIGLSDGEVLTTYFKDGRLNIPEVTSFGAEYWYLLLAPLVIPMCIAAVLTRKGKARIAADIAGQPLIWQFLAVFVGLAAFAIVRIFHGGSGVLEAVTGISTLQGDTTTIVEKRMELFDSGTAAAWGILYSGLPALSHVAMFMAKGSGRSWRVIVLVAIAATAGLSLATFQIAPAVVFIAASIVGAAHLGMVRMTWAKATVYGVAFLLLLQALNSWKFEGWTFVENAQHIVFRMPAAYLYYLDCFPDTVPFLGTDWIGALTGHGLDPGAPFVVSRFMYPASASIGAMAAPAHVQAYAEGGALNAMICIFVVGLLIAGVGQLRRRATGGAIWHGLYIQSLVMLYYLTQASLRGVAWHGYGLWWALLPLLLLRLASLKPTSVRGINRTVRSAVFSDRWPVADAARK